MGHPRITYIVYTVNCLLIILALAFAMAFYTTGLKNSCESARPAGPSNPLTVGCSPEAHTHFFPFCPTPAPLLHRSARSPGG